MAILVGWFLAPDKDYAVQGTLATPKLPKTGTRGAPLYLKVKVYRAKRLTSKTILGLRAWD
jgi:hypothetical protein